jgi:GTP diphosphokinase / guanosine-3',5'-bis(diphosphate) 3'-diphosphatase
MRYSKSTAKGNSIDRIGILKDFPEHFSGDRSNVRGVKVGTFPNQTEMIDLCVDITDKQQLDQVTAQMSKMADVLSIRCR